MSQPLSPVPPPPLRHASSPAPLILDPSLFLPRACLSVVALHLGGVAPLRVLAVHLGFPLQHVKQRPKHARERVAVHAEYDHRAVRNSRRLAIPVAEQRDFPKVLARPPVTKLRFLPRINLGNLYIALR